MIALLGDIHGEAWVLQKKTDAAVESGATALIQVGDFGVWSWSWPKFAALDYKLPVYFIEGNHEYFPMLYCMDPDQRCFPTVPSQLHYQLRGTVATIDGKRIGFLGGGASVDKAWRTPGGDWFKEEEISAADADKLLVNANGHIDLLVTHVPPQSITQKHFDANELRMFNLPPTWRDPSMDQVERVWQSLDKPPLICGHMHRSVYDAEENVRILDINELISYGD